MAMHWMEMVKRLTVGQGKEAAGLSGERVRKARIERLISSVTGAGDWDLSLSDNELAVHARNLAASLGGTLNLSDVEMIEIGEAVVWNLHFLPESTGD